MTKAGNAASVNAQIARLDAMIASQWRDVESYLAEFESIKRDIPPAPYGDEERKLRYEKLRVIYQALMIKSSIINAAIHLVRIAVSNDA